MTQEYRSPEAMSVSASASAFWALASSASITLARWMASWTRRWLAWTSAFLFARRARFSF